MATLWTFELLLQFDQLLSSSLQSEDNICTNHKYNYFPENVLCLKNDKLIKEIYLKNLGAIKT